MGWSGGTDVFRGLWGAVRDFIPEDRHEVIARKVVEVLEEMDWDTVDEIVRDDWPETVAAAGLVRCIGCGAAVHPSECGKETCWLCEVI